MADPQDACSCDENLCQRCGRTKMPRHFIRPEVREPCLNCPIEVIVFKAVEEGDRCFGHYHCSNCHNKWMSGYTWPGKGQQCQHCRTNVYAHLLRSPRRPETPEEVSNAPHPEGLCEECQVLGHKCYVPEVFEDLET